MKLDLGLSGNLPATCLFRDEVKMKISEKGRNVKDGGVRR